MRRLLVVAAAAALAVAPACTNLVPPTGAGGGTGGGSQLVGTVTGPGVPGARTKVAVAYGVPAPGLVGATAVPLTGNQFSVALDNSQSTAYVAAFDDTNGNGVVDRGEASSYSPTCAGCSYLKLTQVNGTWTVLVVNQSGNPQPGSLAGSTIAFAEAGTAAYPMASGR